MTWTLIVEREAERGLRRFPKRDRDRIVAALLAMQQDPFSGDVVHLRSSAVGYRRRVGSYRILFYISTTEAAHQRNRYYPARIDDLLSISPQGRSRIALPGLPHRLQNRTDYSHVGRYAAA